jgi:DNA-binding NtrC family response regulator
MGTIKILIVDDEIEFAEPLSQRITKRNFDCKTASGVEEALVLLAHGWLPEVVILDLHMPGHDGLAALDIIKSKSPNSRFIMLTGHPSVDSGQEGMKKGLFDYLMKPVSIDVLVEKIEEATGMRK